MKRLVAVLLAGSMVLGLAACKKGENTTTPEDTSDSSLGMDESIEVTSEEDPTDDTGTEDDGVQRSQATTELFNGALALDEHFEDPAEFDWHTYSESGGTFTLAEEDEIPEILDEYKNRRTGYEEPLLSGVP